MNVNHPALVAALEAYNRRLEELLALALLADCRLAVSELVPTGGTYSFGCMPGKRNWSPHPLETPGLAWDFVMLLPGEKPPKGKRWTIYERRTEGWKGRSA
jgi:hypothetical protein